MTPDHISLARSLLYSLLGDIRREAVPLVDAFDVPDEILNSALGRYDGDVYRHLYEWAQRAPRNRKKVGTLGDWKKLSLFQGLKVYTQGYLWHVLSLLLRSMISTTNISRNY